MSTVVKDGIIALVIMAIVSAESNFLSVNLRATYAPSVGVNRAPICAGSTGPNTMLMGPYLNVSPTSANFTMMIKNPMNVIVRTASGFPSVLRSHESFILISYLTMGIPLRVCRNLDDVID